jgi:hypothetical protein
MADRFATAQARSALAGIVLAATEDDHGRPLFVASRLAMIKAFCNLDEVGAWLDDIACQGSTRSAVDGSSLAQGVEA